MKKFTVMVASLLVAGGLSAQNFEDALRTSETFPRGNARFMSMSGAMGALGGNASAIGVNPAGSAIARSGVLEITPAFTYIKSENHFQGNYNRRFETAFRVPNFSLMFARETPDAGVLSGISYGFAVNNQNIFDASVRYDTKNATSSFSDEALWAAEQAGDIERFDPFTNLFYKTYLIDQNDDGAFFSDFRGGGTQYGQRQITRIDRSGGKNEYLFNFGLDFSQYVYVGADLSIQGINHTRIFTVEEQCPQENFEFLNGFTYRSNLAISGNGLMGKFGFIARPVEYIRLGLAYHTPTKFFLTEKETQRVKSSFYKSIFDDDNVVWGDESTTNEYDYSITTPGKTVASLGVVFKNVAMLGIDYESINYGNAYIDSRFDAFAYADENDGIKENLTRVDNLKIGAEAIYGMYSFRLGTALYGNPYEKYKNDDIFYRTDISAGLGIKTEGGFYCDFAWVKSTQTKYNYLYTNYVGDDVEGKSKIKKSDFAVTLGFRF